jgi:hypothetical protein
MNVEQELEEWKKDCRIDPNTLDESSRVTPELHAKYLGLHSRAKLKLKDAEFKQKDLLKYKWLWFNGKLSQDEIETRGWDHDPFNGLKILKGDMEQFFEADSDLVASEARIQYLKTVVETLREIVTNLNWRHQTIGNMIRYKQFEAGF